MTDPYAQYKDDNDQTTVDKLDQLQTFADAWKDATEEVERLTELLAAANALVYRIETKDIPEIMDDDAVQLEAFTTKSGLKIKVSEKIRCKPKESVAQQSYQWLRDNGHEKLLKRVISMDFAPGEDDKAESFLKNTLAIDPDLEISDKTAVHWATLDKFAREKLEAGEELPKDLFPIFRQRVAKIK